MSRFKKLSHAIWHCQYHIVYVPKYRYRILQGKVAYEVERCIGLDEDKIRRYVQYQERKEKGEDQGRLFE